MNLPVPYGYSHSSIRPYHNVADKYFGATILKGKNDHCINGEFHNVDAYSYGEKREGILVKLNQVYEINHLAFRLYDKDDRSYYYSIFVSEHNRDYQMLASRCDKGFVDMYFEPRRVKYLWFIGGNTTNTNFTLVYLNANCVPDDAIRNKDALTSG